MRTIKFGEVKCLSSHRDEVSAKPSSYTGLRTTYTNVSEFFTHSNEKLRVDGLEVKDAACFDSILKSGS